MLKIQFKNFCLRLEHLENQLNYTFSLREKDILRGQIERTKNDIDIVLDKYNLSLTKEKI